MFNISHICSSYIITIFFVNLDLEAVYVELVLLYGLSKVLLVFWEALPFNEDLRKQIKLI